MELSMVDGILRSYDDRILGSGVDILQIITHLRSVPNSDCHLSEIILNVSQSLNRMGYQHPNE